MMDVLERAKKLLQEADDVLDMLRLAEITRPYGELVPTGSYFLDTMVYPDIDVFLPTLPLEAIFAIGAGLAACEKVIQVVYEPSRDPSLPGGRYLKPRIQYGDWGRPWKVDIWSVDPQIIQRQIAPMLRFKERMTPALREKILRYKLSVLTAGHRTPMHSGFFIYQAFIDEGLEDFAAVTAYLRQNGISVE
jgi:hypothetical protein